MAGAVAGIVSNTAVAPLDILRLNLMVSQQKTNALRVARKIFAEGGIFAFWQGNPADVCRAVPASAIRFYSFAVYKARLEALIPPADDADATAARGRALAVTSILAGGFAGMVQRARFEPRDSEIRPFAAAVLLVASGWTTDF